MALECRGSLAVYVAAIADTEQSRDLMEGDWRWS